MSSPSEKRACGHWDLVCLHALRTLPASEVPAVESHIADCTYCRQELELLRPIVDFFVCWPTDVLRPSVSLWDRLAERITEETGSEPPSAGPLERAEPDWEEVAPGVSCKLLATDTERELVSMLVRLAPGAEYPPHRHAEVEELHLLDGELVVDDKKLFAGDYIRAEAGSADALVWSETGCTCVLVTSTRDELR
jgi:quercetin dioxygenase-like cupin family protein